MDINYFQKIKEAHSIREDNNAGQDLTPHLVSIIQILAPDISIMFLPTKNFLGRYRFLGENLSDDEDKPLTASQNIEIGTKLDVQFNIQTPNGTVLQWFCGSV